MDRTIYLLGLNHRCADVSLRERFALSGEACAVQTLLPFCGSTDAHGVSEAMILSTCNRVEVIAVGNSPDIPHAVLSAWAAHVGGMERELGQHVYTYSGHDAVRHLFRVASGLDSLVLGEPQILGQLKDSYRKAVEEKAAHVILNRLLHKAFMTAKRVRSETGVAASAVSVSSAAVSLARRIFGDLAGRKALLVGAGDMAELAATHLAEGHGASISVTNRTFERAVALAGKYNGTALPFENLTAHLVDADIVITSTGASEPVINYAMTHAAMAARRGKTMFFIDIAVPRDIDERVNDIDNVYLYNIDDLAEVAEAGRAARREEAGRAECIVEDETERFCTWLQTLGLQGTIADMVKRTDALLREEMEKTLRRIGPVSPEVEAAFAQMVVGMGKKLNHNPITFLKRRCAEEDGGIQFVTLARRMFNLDQDNVPENAHIGRKRLP